MASGATSRALGGPLAGWLGQIISGARDADGVYAVDRYYDLAIDAQGAADPQGQFRAHLAKPSRGIERFAAPAKERLELLLGHYHHAQSLSSADALVFNAFGPFAKPRVPRRWINEVLTAAFGPADYPADWVARLWKREEVTVPGMAATIEVEPAVELLASGWKFVVVAQWQDDFHEGAADAFALHARQLTDRDLKNSGLLVVVPSPGNYPPAADTKSVFRRYFTPLHDAYVATPLTMQLPTRVRVATWESLGERADVHPHGAELRAYVEWRVAQLSL